MPYLVENDGSRVWGFLGVRKLIEDAEVPLDCGKKIFANEGVLAIRNEFLRIHLINENDMMREGFRKKRTKTYRKNGARDGMVGYDATMVATVGQ
jgi:hypothetical protein